MTWANSITDLYIFLLLMISLYGLHALIITALYLANFRRADPPAPEPLEWPKAAVQLPIFNEQSMAGRMIDLACAFDYPKDRLVIQVLDDSTDNTTEVVLQKAQTYRALGYDIQVIHRVNRDGYKAGALQGGLAQTDAEFIAIFDADFMPPPDFLKRIIPRFAADPCLGLLQTRWGHSNRFENLITRVQSLFLDGHQIVEQVARSRSGLLLNFNGTGGVWRAACLRDSGGWQADTLAEDIDISYRAQMRGWRLAFLPEMVVPGEVPLTLTNFKKQQNRWTYGHVQVFRKLLSKIWTVRGLSLPQRLGASFHLSTNFMQLAALVMFLLSVPMTLLRPKEPASLGLISLVSVGPTVLFAVSQVFGYRSSLKNTLARLLYLPLLVLVAVGLTASNTGALLRVFVGSKLDWTVTPKTLIQKKPARTVIPVTGAHSAPTPLSKMPASVWVEIGLSIYCAVGLSFALRGAPELIPLTALGMLSFGIVGFTGMVESSRPQKSPVQVEMASK